MHPDATSFNGLAKALAAELAQLLKPEIARLASPVIQPALLTVEQAAVFLGRSPSAIEHLIFQKDLPVVRVGRRVHLDRRDLHAFIEKHKY